MCLECQWQRIMFYRYNKKIQYLILLLHFINKTETSTFKTVPEMPLIIYKRYRSRVENHPNPLISALDSIPGNSQRRLKTYKKKKKNIQINIKCSPVNYSFYQVIHVKYITVNILIVKLKEKNIFFFIDSEWYAMRNK